MVEPAKEAANIVTRLDEWDKHVGHGTTLFKAAKDEIERLREENEALRFGGPSELDNLEAEIERLRAALEVIGGSDRSGDPWKDFDRARDIAWAALHPENVVKVVNEQNAVEK